MLKQVLDSILTFGEDELVEGLKAFIEAIVNENVSLVISRQLLSEVKFFFTLPYFKQNLCSGGKHFDSTGGLCLQSCISLHPRGGAAQGDQL